MKRESWKYKVAECPVFDVRLYNMYYKGKIMYSIRSIGEQDHFHKNNLVSLLVRLLNESTRSKK